MEQEISIREIIETILKGKWLILGITSFIILIAIIYSFLFVNPTYETKATIMVNNVEQPVGALNEYINSATSRDMVIDMMKSPEVIKKTIEEMNLDLTVQAFQNSLNVMTVDNNDSLIRITFKGTEREKLTSILNNLIENTIENTESSINTFLESQEDLYLQKMEEEKQLIKEYLKEYNELEEAVGLPLLILFQQNTSSPQYIIEATESLLQELRELDKEIQIQYEEINRLIDRAHDKYQQYNDYYNDVLTAKSLNITNNRINLISSPFTDNNPISPNKMLNITVAFILGVIISIFVVFFREYWRNTKEN